MIIMDTALFSKTFIDLLVREPDKSRWGIKRIIYGLQVRQLYTRGVSFSRQPSLGKIVAIILGAIIVNHSNVTG